MNEIFGFNELKVGQRVNVKGKLAADGTFVAIEIEMQPPKDYAEIEGLILSIDQQNGKINLLNRQLTLPNGVEVFDSDRHEISLNGLKAKALVKLKGNYSTPEGFVIKSINIKKSRNFTIDKLKGNVDKVDLEKKSLELIGFTVQANSRTAVEVL